MTADHDDTRFDLTLDQLCQQAGVTVRTVRYYISEGLLPPPHGQGPAARYGEGHLQRLGAIANLKEHFLPLREIRRVLDGLDDRGVADLAAARPDTTMAVASPVPAAAPAPMASPAAAYIEDVLGHSAPTPRRSARQPEPPPGPEKTWRRLSITDEAELLIEADLYDRRQEQIESLLAWARRLLAGS